MNEIINLNANTMDEKFNRRDQSNIPPGLLALLKSNTIEIL